MDSESTLRRSWPSEREVAEELPIEADSAEARRVLAEVPFWFHTFALNRGLDLYTPGEARDHGYRLASIPESFEGLSVLDVGTFDGFYSFLAEARGAERVLAVDNQQYVQWVKERWGVELTGGEGFRAIHGLLGSRVEYLCADAFDLTEAQERFDFIFCFGLLHRVENPLGLLRILAGLLAQDGQMLVETYGVVGDRGDQNGAIHVPGPGDVYARDHFVHWQFSAGALAGLAAHTERPYFEVHATPMVDGHPRIIGVIS